MKRISWLLISLSSASFIIWAYVGCIWLITRNVPEALPIYFSWWAAISAIVMLTGTICLAIAYKSLVIQQLKQLITF